VLLSAVLAEAVSGLPPDWKTPVSRALWSLLLASVTFTVVNYMGILVDSYGPRLRLPRPTTLGIKNAVRIAAFIVAVLFLLDMWGVPTTVFLVLLVVAALAGAFALRDAVPNLVAGIQVGAARQVKPGDFIRLESGEEGYVMDMSWNSISLRTLEDRTILVPNSRLLKYKLTNYGRPLRTATHPFIFYNRTHLTEPTGMRARDLRELVDTLRTAPDAVVYHHTHQFMEEHQYLIPTPPNEFAVWVTDALGEEALGETLASVDTFEFPSLTALRDRFVGIIEEHLAKGAAMRLASPDRQFFFMKTVSVVAPTPYVAHDLRGFVEAVRKISPGSLYFHMFESRLRLGRGLNDFSAWLQEELGDEDLGREIARLDPYTSTLEAIRSSVVQLVEKRIK
jgi:hypothetical protein